MNVIEIDHLTYSYPGTSNPILRDISIQIEKGDFLAIVGNNGCGKSTFCKTLNGLIPQFISGKMEGRVLACGLNTKETNVGALAQKVGYVYQDFENQIIRPTVLDDASYACLNYAMTDYKERGMKALEQCGLIGKQNDYIWQLSGGQTHLLALAGVVSLQPDVLILDEPTANQELVNKVGIRPPEIYTMGQTIDRKAQCYTIDDFYSGSCSRSGIIFVRKRCIFPDRIPADCHVTVWWKCRCHWTSAYSDVKSSHSIVGFCYDFFRSRSG